MLKRSHDDDGLFFLSCNDIARIMKFNGRPFTGIQIDDTKLECGTWTLKCDTQDRDSVHDSRPRLGPRV